MTEATLDANVGTVLVVDDEILVRMDLVDTLTGAGYRTREACCAMTAIEVLKHAPDIKVLFTDIQMPGPMNGLALSHIVRKRWPQMMIVICSGNIKPNPGDMPSEAEFISKPFDPTEMSRIVRNVGVYVSANLKGTRRP